MIHPIKHNTFVHLPLLPSDWLPSVLMEFLGFLQLRVWVGQGNQDQDGHQASVQWRGEKHRYAHLKIFFTYGWQPNFRLVALTFASIAHVKGDRSFALGTPLPLLDLDQGTASRLSEVGFFNLTPIPLNPPLAETGMLLPGKYSEGKKKQRAEKYEVRANLKDFVPEEENTDKWATSKVITFINSTFSFLLCPWTKLHCQHVCVSLSIFGGFAFDFSQKHAITGLNR